MKEGNIFFIKIDSLKGNLSLQQLDALLICITSRKKNIGEDICGEYPRSAVEYYKPDYKRIIKKNEMANKNIIKLTLTSNEVGKSE